jgi:hypothetical protein
VEATGDCTFEPNVNMRFCPSAGNVQSLDQSEPPGTVS